MDVDALNHFIFIHLLKTVQFHLIFFVPVIYILVFICDDDFTVIQEPQQTNSCLAQYMRFFSAYHVYLVHNQMHHPILCVSSLNSPRFSTMFLLSLA